MDLTLHNSMTKTKQVFNPADSERVTMYMCGPTVYNHAHIGNFRAAVAFDMVYRVLRHKYGADKIVYARNFTDIEDKIIVAAKKINQPIEAITTKYAEIYRNESGALNILKPNLEPLATAHVTQMITIIEQLLDAGVAYSEQDHILFDITQYKEYGALSNLKMDDMIAGARVEVAPYKRNPADFVLWKPSNEDEPGWETPGAWGLSGPGRPGWHLECSAMIKENLGTTIDLHCGGQDLRFPHHENEIAQSVCAHNAPLANFWLHNGFLQMGKDKMSKSVGNVALLCDLLGDWQGEVLRWALISAHYRQPLEWSEDLLVQSKKQLDRFYRLFAEHNITDSTKVDTATIHSLYDDINTPGAIASLHALRDKANNETGTEKTGTLQTLLASGRLMGLFEQDPGRWFQGESHDTGESASDIDALVEARTNAKKSRDFARADAIRDELLAKGIVLEDGPDGTSWRRE